MPSDSLLLRLLRPIVDRLIRRKELVLLTALFMTLAAAPLASRLEFDQSLESFFTADDPLLLAWRDSKAWFGEDEFILVAYSDPKLVHLGTPSEPDAEVDTVQLNKLRDFARELSTVPGLVADSTQSLEGLLRPKFGDSFAARVLARSYARMRQNDILEFGEHLVISHDRQTTAVILRMVPRGTEPIPREETFQQIRTIAAAHDPPAFVAGEPIQVNDMFRYVDQDSRVLGWASSALLVGMILFLFRSLRWVLLPFLVVHVTLVWTKAILVASGMHLSMVSSTLNSLVTIIAIATVTHVTVNYRELRLTLDRTSAFRETMLRLGPPVFWTCLTTAIGFGSLLSSQLVPVQSFGLMLATAALIVLVVCTLILPGGVLALRFDSDPKPTLAEARLVRFLRHTGRGIDRHPRAWLVGLSGLMLICSAGLWRLRVETDFSKNFRENSDIVQALKFFERELGGAGTWEIGFPFPQAVTEKSLVPVRKLAQTLRELRLKDGTHLTKVIALSDGVDFAPGLGVDQKIQRLQAIQPEFISSLLNADAGQMRIVLRAHEQQPAETKLALIDSVTTKAREYFPAARPTGFFLLLSHLIHSLLKDQLVSFLLASAGIFLCMSIAFRNLWIGLLSLLPNLFPLVLVVGGMGWFNVPINIGTAMIACVSMGLTVDSSIHYISGYLRARRAGASYAEAVKETHGTVGVAMVFANLVLALGFLVLSLSNFIPLVYFGVLVSLSMLSGLFGSLVMLPLLLRWVPVRQPSLYVDVSDGT
ncbi:MAG: efflux RND transporter permease subunit [Planctomycetaceae bacterium]